MWTMRDDIKKIIIIKLLFQLIFSTYLPKVLLKF